MESSSFQPADDAQQLLEKQFLRTAEETAGTFSGLQLCTPEKFCLWAAPLFAFSHNK